MKRKIVKQGAATMMISLPSKWVRKNNLDKGDEIDIEEKDNQIIISNEKISKEKSKAVINVSGLGILVNRTLISLYIKGYDELEINFSEPDEVKDFQKRVINELIGFEIIKQSQKSFTVRDITGVSDQNIDDIIRRIFLIIDSMAEELEIAIDKKQSMDPVIETDTSINKFVNFSLRILNKKGYTEYNKTPQIYSIISHLEETGDIYKKIARELKETKKYPKEILPIIKELRSFVNMFKDLLFKFNREDSLKLAKKYEHIKKLIDNKDLISFYLYEINETIIRMNNYLLAISV
ncbi:Antidote-toxin recognition MazE, bacterial antitoxin [uncultured archaeon]|nr:Antidote-toxin recognition MazE, bacterial antitoxin [uncultured archaeon]